MGKRGLFFTSLMVCCVIRAWRKVAKNNFIKELMYGVCSEGQLTAKKDANPVKDCAMRMQSMGCERFCVVFRGAEYHGGEGVYLKTKRTSFRKQLPNFLSFS